MIECTSYEQYNEMTRSIYFPECLHFHNFLLPSSTSSTRQHACKTCTGHNKYNGPSRLYHAREVQQLKDNPSRHGLIQVEIVPNSGTTAARRIPKTSTLLQQHSILLINIAPKSRSPIGRRHIESESSFTTWQTSSRDYTKLEKYISEKIYRIHRTLLQHHKRLTVNMAGYQSQIPDDYPEELPRYDPATGHERGRTGEARDGKAYHGWFERERENQQRHSRSQPIPDQQQFHQGAASSESYRPPGIDQLTAGASALSMNALASSYDSGEYSGTMGYHQDGYYPSGPSNVAGQNYYSSSYPGDAPADCPQGSSLQSPAPQPDSRLWDELQRLLNYDPKVIKPTWACARCKIQKERCNGQRPKCGTCTADRIKRCEYEKRRWNCDVCHGKSVKGCDYGKPCNNCQEKKRKCNYSQKRQRWSPEPRDYVQGQPPYTQIHQPLRAFTWNPTFGSDPRQGFSPQPRAQTPVHQSAEQARPEIYYPKDSTLQTHWNWDKANPNGCEACKNETPPWHCDEKKPICDRCQAVSTRPVTSRGAHYARKCVYSHREGQNESFVFSQGTGMFTNAGTSGGGPGTSQNPIVVDRSQPPPPPGRPPRESAGYYIDRGGPNNAHWIREPHHSGRGAPRHNIQGELLLGYDMEGRRAGHERARGVWVRYLTDYEREEYEPWREWVLSGAVGVSEGGANIEFVYHAGTMEGGMATAAGPSSGAHAVVGSREHAAGPSSGQYSSYPPDYAAESRDIVHTTHPGGSGSGSGSGSGGPIRRQREPATHDPYPRTRASHTGHGASGSSDRRQSESTPRRDERRDPYDDVFSLSTGGSSSRSGRRDDGSVHRSSREKRS
jgi:hypothetical protein